MTTTISIHAPRVGRDNQAFVSTGAQDLFQSTRPVWGATMHIYTTKMDGRISIHAPRVGRDFDDIWIVGDYSDISIHAPRVGRDDHYKRVVERTAISIHAPRVGRDIDAVRAAIHDVLFQSTRPVWGATVIAISCLRFPGNFNPRAPCGARRK